MTITSYCRIAAAAVLLVGGTAAFANDGIRSYESLPSLPAAAYHAPENSWGLPHADGHKPGKGYGYGHYKDRGRGHEIGRGHGHDDDHNKSPG